MRLPIVVAVTNVAFVLAACPPAGEGAEGDACGVVPGDVYEAPDSAENAAGALALRAQLDTLTGAATMRGAEEGAVVVDDVADLTGPFTGGAANLKDITHAEATVLIDDAFAEFVEVIAAGDVTLVDAAGAFTPGAAGGIYGSTDRGINEGGLEVRQIVDKALFGGVFYGYALSLTAGTINEGTVDAIAAVWGGNSTLDAAGELTDAANYTNGMGYHQDAKDALIAARAYAKDAACVAERNEALVRFFRVWEKAMFARFSFYANAGATGVAAAVDDDDYAAAFHELAEGIGLVAGFRGLPSPASGPLAGAHRIVDDAQIERMLADLGVNLGDLSSSTTGEILIEGNFAAQVRDVEAVLGAALDVDAAELTGWRDPTAG